MATQLLSEQYLLRHFYTQPRRQALGRQLAAGVNDPLSALMKASSAELPLVSVAPTRVVAGAAAPAPRAGFSPLKLDIGSMRRLRVTKGIYLPSDTPMHGIFGSKDVIHS